MYLTKKDKIELKEAFKYKKKNPNFRIFVASKYGGNAKGKGAERSVILASNDGKEWYQYLKFWGNNNKERAKEFVILVSQVV